MTSTPPSRRDVLKGAAAPSGRRSRQMTLYGRFERAVYDAL